MGRRNRDTMFYCGHEGCHEGGIFSYSSNAEYNELYQKYGGGKYRCVRHAHPNEVLGTDNLEIHFTKTVAALPHPKWVMDHKFWTEPGKYPGSGFIYGDGWKAYADDFPEGTVLEIEVHVKVVLPNPAPAACGESEER